MTAILVEATATIAEGLVPLVEDMRTDAQLPEAASEAALSQILRSLKDAPSASSSAVGPGIDATARFEALRPAIASLPDDRAANRAVSGPYLSSFVDLALERSDMGSDKSCRWLGYAEGVVAARGGVLPEGAGPSADASGIDELSYRLGFVQGALAAYGLLDVDAERDRTRPIFHAAYAAMGLAKPATIEVGA